MWRLSRPAAAGLTLSILLTACTVGPDFHRPAEPIDTHFVPEALPRLASGKDEQTVTASEPMPEWWHAFGSAALDDTMQRAFSGNLDLVAAEARFDQARDTLAATTGRLYPEVSLDAGLGREQYGAEFSGPQRIPPFNYFAIGPSVRYLLDYTGGARRAVEAGRAQAAAAGFRLQAVRLSLSGQVMQQVLSIAAARAEIAVVSGLIADDQRNLELVETAFRAGSVARLDVVSARTQLAADQTRLPVLKQDLSVARHALAILSGQTPASGPVPDFDLAELRLPAELPIGLPSELAHRRPDILAAEAALHAATAEVGVATSLLYPQITLTASIGAQSTQLSHWFDASSLAWGMAGGLTAPLFDGGTRRAQRRAASDALRVALADYRQVVLAALGQVADVLTALDRDAERIEIQRQAVAASQDNLMLSRTSYTAGNIGVLQVLDAERQSQQAQLGLLDARVRRYRDTADLLLALGGNPLPDGERPPGASTTPVAARSEAPAKGR